MSRINSSPAGFYMTNFYLPNSTLAYYCTVGWVSEPYDGRLVLRDPFSLICVHSYSVGFFTFSQICWTLSSIFQAHRQMFHYYKLIRISRIYPQPILFGSGSNLFFSFLQPTFWHTCVTRILVRFARLQGQCHKIL